MVIFNNSNGKGKVYVRSLVKDLVNRLKPKSTFTLPNLNFEVEEIASQYGHVITCESNKTIYNKQKSIMQLMRNPNIEINHAKASIVLENKTFDFVWLDLCGCYSKELINCLDAINTKYLVITIAKARDKFNKDNRTFFYSNLFRIYNYKVEKLIEYNDSFPMQVYFLLKNQ